MADQGKSKMKASWREGGTMLPVFMYGVFSCRPARVMGIQKRVNVAQETALVISQKLGF